MLCRHAHGRCIGADGVGRVQEEREDFLRERGDKKQEEFVHTLFMFVFWIQAFSFLAGIGAAVANVLVLSLLETRETWTLEEKPPPWYDITSYDPRVVLTFITRGMNAGFGVFMVLREATNLR